MSKEVKRQYTEEFKMGAIRLVIDQGYSKSEAAQNLGINVSNLKRWINAYKAHGVDAFPGHGALRPQAEELRQLREENRRLRMEREILKKAAAFFARETK